MQNRTPRVSRKQALARRRRKRNRAIGLAAAACAVLALAVVLLINRTGSDAKSPAASPTAPQASPAPTQEAAAVPTEDHTEAPTPQPSHTPYVLRSATMISIGDIVIHDAIRAAAHDEATDTYDFTPMFELVKDIISDADYAAR